VVVSDKELYEWIEKCKTKSRKADVVVLRNAIINYLYLNINTTQQDVAKFLNFERSTISRVVENHFAYSQDPAYVKHYIDLDYSNIKNIFFHFISENK